MSITLALAALAGKIALTKALHRLGQGADPGAALREAGEVFQRGVDAAPWDLGWRVSRASAAIAGLRWAERNHDLDAAAFQAARAPLRPGPERARGR